MSLIPLIPESAPFTSEQRFWLNGFLAGILSRGPAMAVPGGAPPPPSVKASLIIAFGSQSGNAEGLAKKLVKQATGRGFQARAAGLESLEPDQLPAAGNLMIVTSTWGDGEMPDNAAGFWEKLNRNGSSPRLDGLAFSVLALGDLNYGETFCQAGKMLDQRLEALGARRLHPRMDCDVDFDGPAEIWSEAVFQSLENPGSVTVSAPSPLPAEAAAPEGVWTKKNPFRARLSGNLRLNSAGSAKDTRHIAFALEDSGLVYETGDALGVWPTNCPEVVDGVLESHRLNPDSAVPLPEGGETSLREALLSHYEVRPLVGLSPAAETAPADFLKGLRRLQPRLYSIASSQKAHPDEAHLCVGVVRYEADGVAHKGVASTCLADRMGEGSTAGIFVHTAKHFRVPKDGAVPIIMVGPGTGIAPFRAFLQERQATGAPGGNWLFFGDQHAATDFLYRDQLENWRRDGLLTRLDLAFSRDQAERLYVQTRMLENAAGIWAWLEEGAHFYVCGDASRMAKDVDSALHTIIQTQGGRSPEEAAALINELKKSKRYARDVY